MIKKISTAKQLRATLVSVFLIVGIAFSSLYLTACDTEKNTGGDKKISELQAAKNLFESDVTGAHILVFTKTKGWHHDSIDAGVAALQKMAEQNKFSVAATDDAAQFTDAQLKTFNAIIFLNTTRDVLDENQQIAMERFIQAGGGFVGVHAAADTEWEGDWFWYRKLVGGVFKSHPNQPSNVQSARINLSPLGREILPNLSEVQRVSDEWYNYKDFSEFNQVLMTVDESSYVGGEQGIYHPITWYHNFDGGRSFYTGLGHTIEQYSNPEFLKLLLSGIRYAVGGKPTLDYTKSRPDNNHFSKKVITTNLNEPINVAFFKNGDALISERAGTVQLIDYQTQEKKQVGQIDVTYLNFFEMGLLAVAIDPEFDKTHFIYATLTYEKSDGVLVEALARFKFLDGKIDNKTREILLEFPTDRHCCHTGGNITFDPDGNLFVSTGDNTNPHDKNGSAPIDERPDHAKDDALRSAGNTQDLRGKILRIHPLTEGGYKIPDGNLFADAKEGRPEIYVMGARNPYKITYDSKKRQLFYGDVGPDAGAETELLGPAGYDEINRVNAAGNFGWPLVIGDNYPYKDYDFAANTSKDLFNPLAPINHSPRNTGLKQLPPAQPALIWYPYGVSDRFPEMGKGGRLALVAGVYHAEDYKNFSATGRQPKSAAYPSYYENKLFIEEFMRNWVKAVSFDSLDRITKIEPVAPQVDYASPIDARFAPDGTLYVLEYGKAWFKGNPEASLSRIEYSVEEKIPAVDANAKTSAAEKSSAAPEGHQAPSADAVALELMRANGCKNCHSVDQKIVGPAFKDVAAKYKGDTKALAYLMNKIKNGGNGVWGEVNMPSFATLSDDERKALATYVLSLGNKTTEDKPAAH